MPQWLRVRAVGLERRGDEARLVAALEQRRARAVAVEEDHRIVFGIGELVHHVDADDEHGLQIHGFVAMQPAAVARRGRKRRAGAADVERAGVRGAELVLQRRPRSPA